VAIDFRTTRERPLSTRSGHSLASQCRHNRLTKTPMIRPPEVHQISGMQPSRIMKESWSIDNQRRFLCIIYRHKSAMILRRCARCTHHAARGRHPQ
jgi:hypothetical protein